MNGTAQIYKNIKSNYILQNIFSYIDKPIFLKIVYCSKSIQKKLGITIDDFKNVSGKILRKEKSFSILEKEVDTVYIQGTDIKVFKGHYKNGKKNGKGKEYYTNKKKKFEGDYFNGIKISGTGYDKFGNVIYKIENKKVIEKYKNGKPVFKGEYLNWKKYNGIGYDINGNKVYEIKKGKGKVKEFFDDGVLKFEGEYCNGERNGQGKRYDYEGEILFEGIYLNGEKWTGKGKEYHTDHDKVDDTDENPFKDIDLFSIGKRKQKKDNEYGFMSNFFESAFKNKNLTSLTKKQFGLTREEKILKFEGEYLNGQKKGKEYNQEGDLIYEGEFLYDKWHGKGKQYHDRGIFGRFEKKLLDHEGIFENGKFIKNMKVD